MLATTDQSAVTTSDLICMLKNKVRWNSNISMTISEVLNLPPQWWYSVAKFFNFGPYSP